MSESTPVIGVKGPSVRACWVSAGLLRSNEEDGGIDTAVVAPATSLVW